MPEVHFILMGIYYGRVFLVCRVWNWAWSFGHQNLIRWVLICYYQILLSKLLVWCQMPSDSQVSDVIWSTSDVPGTMTSLRVTSLFYMRKINLSLSNVSFSKLPHQKYTAIVLCSITNGSNHLLMCKYILPTYKDLLLHDLAQDTICITCQLGFFWFGCSSNISSNMLSWHIYTTPHMWHE